MELLFDGKLCKNLVASSKVEGLKENLIRAITLFKDQLFADLEKMSSQVKFSGRFICTCSNIHNKFLSFACFTTFDAFSRVECFSNVIGMHSSVT